MVVNLCCFVPKTNPNNLYNSIRIIPKPVNDFSYQYSFKFCETKLSGKSLRVDVFGWRNNASMIMWEQFYLVYVTMMWYPGDFGDRTAANVFKNWVCWRTYLSSQLSCTQKLRWFKRSPIAKEDVEVADSSPCEPSCLVIITFGRCCRHYNFEKLNFLKCKIIKIERGKQWRQIKYFRTLSFLSVVA